MSETNKLNVSSEIHLKVEDLYFFGALMIDNVMKEFFGNAYCILKPASRRKAGMSKKRDLVETAEQLAKKKKIKYRMQSTFRSSFFSKH